MGGPTTAGEPSSCAHGGIHFLGLARRNLGRENPFETFGLLDRLPQVAAADERLGVGEAGPVLDRGSQGPLTIPSMGFEPQRLAMGEGPVSRLSPTERRLAEWF